MIPQSTRDLCANPHILSMSKEELISFLEKNIPLDDQIYLLKRFIWYFAPKLNITGLLFEGSGRYGFTEEEGKALRKLQLPASSRKGLGRIEPEEVKVFLSEWIHNFPEIFQEICESL